MKLTTTLALAASATLSLAVQAQAGDPAAGENDFKKCRACHTIASADEVIFKGGKTGPNLYNIVGTAAAAGDYKYSTGRIAAAEAGLVWDEVQLVAYLEDPTTFLRDFTGDSSARSKMTFKLKNGEDVAAYLTSVSPDAPAPATN